MSVTTASVICAPPNGRNPGMATVDLAFGELADVAGVDAVTYWRLWDQSEWIGEPSGSWPAGPGCWHDPSTGLDYRNLRGNLTEAVNADVVVFWGDFLHMAPYQAETARILSEEIRCTASAGDAERMVADHLLFDRQSDEVLARTASFGTTLGLNAPADYVGVYGQRLRRFLSRLGAVALRDGYSAQIAREVRGDWSRSHMVPDLALLRPGEASRVTERDGLGVFFARSQLPPEPLAWLGDGLAGATGLRPTWIDWGREPAFWPMNTRKRFRLAWPALEQRQLTASLPARLGTYRSVARGRGLDLASTQPPLAELLAQVASFRAVITDTYHLAVNAWRSGVPAVCVLDAPGRRWSVNSGAPENARDKRWDLYSSLDALAFTTVGGVHVGRRRREVARLARLLADEQAVVSVVERVERRASLGRVSILDALAAISSR